MRQHGKYLQLLTIFIFSVFVNTGCVSVKNSSFHLDAGIIPENHAVLFIAVSTPFPTNASTHFHLDIGNEKTVYLQAEAINRIYVPAGWQGMVLKNVNQDAGSKNTRYEFKKNEIHRFALIEKSILLDEEDQKVEQYFYKLVPTTQQAFQILGAESKLPLVIIY